MSEMYSDSSDNDLPSEEPTIKDDNDKAIPSFLSSSSTSPWTESTSQHEFSTNQKGKIEAPPSNTLSSAEPTNQSDHSTSINKLINEPSSTTSTAEVVTQCATGPSPTTDSPTVIHQENDDIEHVSTVTADCSRSKTNDLRIQLQNLRERTHNTVSQLNEEIAYLSTQLETTRERLLIEQAAKSQVQQRMGLGECREQTLHDALRESRHKHEVTMTAQRAQQEQIQDVCRALQVDVLTQVAPYCLNLKQRVTMVEEEVHTLRAGVQFHLAECDGLRHANRALQCQMKLVREQKKQADLAALEARNQAEDTEARAHDAKVNVHALRRRSDYLSDVVMLYSGSGTGGGNNGTGEAFLAPHINSSARNNQRPPRRIHAPNHLSIGSISGFGGRSPTSGVNSPSGTITQHNNVCHLPSNQQLHSTAPLTATRQPERPNGSPSGRRGGGGGASTPRERLQHKRIEFFSPTNSSGGGRGRGRDTGSGRGSVPTGRGGGRGVTGVGNLVNKSRTRRSR